MPHIPLPEGAPGIVGLLLAYPDTVEPLSALAEVLLRGPSSLTPGEREVIAAFVSSANGCYFCTHAHAAAARNLLGADAALVDQVIADLPQATVSEKLRALLVIAGKVQQGGREVSEEDIVRAREAGADDRAIHDTVLIAAACCMYNRYVDGLATWTPEDAEVYARTGEQLARTGYVHPRQQEKTRRSDAFGFKQPP
jgi:uncharacterized peroxidase-related enzyme